jgi:membrane protease subunit (stomatin/prohibitin family)
MEDDSTEMSDDEVAAVYRALNLVVTEAISQGSKLKISVPGFLMLVVKGCIVFNIANEEYTPDDVRALVDNSILQGIMNQHTNIMH